MCPDSTHLHPPAEWTQGLDRDVTGNSTFFREQAGVRLSGFCHGHCWTWGSWCTWLRPSLRFSFFLVSTPTLVPLRAAGHGSLQMGPIYVSFSSLPSDFHRTFVSAFWCVPSMPCQQLRPLARPKGSHLCPQLDLHHLPHFRSSAHTADIPSPGAKPQRLQITLSLYITWNHLWILVDFPLITETQLNKFRCISRPAAALSVPFLLPTPECSRSAFEIGMDSRWILAPQFPFFGSIPHTLSNQSL